MNKFGFDAEALWRYCNNLIKHAAEIILTRRNHSERIIKL